MPIGLPLLHVIPKPQASRADMNSWGIRNNEIMPANAYDRQLGIDGIISARTPTSMMNP